MTLLPAAREGLYNLRLAGLAIPNSQARKGLLQPAGACTQAGGAQSLIAGQVPSK
jgi:hypothetical protein